MKRISLKLSSGLFRFEQLKNKINQTGSMVSDILAKVFVILGMILKKVVQSNLNGHFLIGQLILNHKRFDYLYSRRLEFHQEVCIDAKHELI